MTDKELILFLQEDISNTYKRNKQLLTALRSAKGVIKELHHEANGAMGFHFWDEYQQNPAMQRINKAIKDGK